MQNHLTSTLQQIYEANLRILQHVPYEQTVTRRVLNTNDYLVNALTTLMCRRYGMVLPNLNSEESTNIILPNIIPPPPPPQQVFATPALGSIFYDPIQVFPSPAQIQEGTRNLTFSSLENPINDSCPISLNNFQPLEVVTQIRGCGHLFNRAQLGIWLRTNCRCPVCRFDVRTYIAADSDDANLEATGEYELNFSQNATAIFNLLSNPTEEGAVVRDLSGNSFMIRSFYAA